MSFKKTAGIAAALMLTGSYSAMAATLNVPTANGIPLAQEALVSASTDVTPAAGTLAAQNQSIRVVKTGGFSASQMLLSFTLTGATFKNAVVAGNLLTGAAGIACSPAATVGIQSGGAAGSSTVTFTVDNASACDTLTFNPGTLKGLASGTNVTVASTLTLASSGAVVDNGITIPASGSTYIAVVDANKGSLGAAASAAINLAGGAVTLTPNGNLASSTQFVSGLMSDIVHQTANRTDLSTDFKVGELDATGVLTLSGLPAAITAAPTLTFPTATQSTANVATVTCSTPASGSSTCTLSKANLLTINGSDTAGSAANSIVATFTVNGTTVITPATINGKLVVTYTGGQTATDTLFDGTIATIGTNACAAEFGSMLGKATTNALTTIRLSNTSATSGKVFVTATDDKGTHSPVVQVTKTNGGASAVNVLDANNLLPAGATIELTGGDIETATLNFASWSGTTRGRARVFVEAAGSSTGSSLAANNGIGSGCKAEAWLCVGSGCTIINQTGDGLTGVTPAPQKN